jgi:hypothetical protein
MWLAVTPPPGWSVREEAGRKIAEGDGGSLEWSALRPLPTQQRHWFAEVLFRDLPAGAVPADLRRESVETEDGWQLLFVECRVVRDDHTVERRLAGFYAFLEHGAHALWRAPDDARYAAGAAAMRERLRGGAPDFRGAPVCVADFWDGVLPLPGDEAPARADIDALYDRGQAHHDRGELAQALEVWRDAAAQAPDDFELLKKVLQVEQALGLPAASATRERLHDLWRSSEDPRVRALDSYVADQFDVGTTRVMAHEPLGAPRPERDLYAFTLTPRGGEPLPVLIRVEASEFARRRGVACLLSVTSGNEYRVVESFAEVPPYPELRARVRQIVESLAG